MMKSFIYRILERRHFWRYASFGEIAEVYTSRTVRVIAMNIVSGFTSVYLFESGYKLSFIIAFWALYFIFKIPFSFVAGAFLTKFGAKRGILISNLLYVPAMVALGFVPLYGVIAVAIWGLFMAVSAAMYQVCYMYDFSKVKSVEHAGKEIAFMNIIEKMAVGLSPLIGGLFAYWFGLQYVIWGTAILFILSAIPLIWLVEPPTFGRLMNVRGFPWASTLRGLVAQTGVGFDFVTTGIVWHLFIVIAIFPGAGWDVYVKLGALSSVTVLSALAASYAYGRLIDTNKGGLLLRLSSVANALVHIGRPFVNSAVSIVGTNVANEASTMGYSMAFMRGAFDTADLSGHRIFYLCLCDAISSVGSALACSVLFLLSSFSGDLPGLRIFFFVAAGFVLLIGFANFNIYRK